MHIDQLTTYEGRNENNILIRTTFLRVLSSESMGRHSFPVRGPTEHSALYMGCLLYTSDAADE